MEVTFTVACLVLSYQNQTRPPGGVVGSLRNLIDGNGRHWTCVIERDRDSAELLEDPRKLREGIGPRR